MFHCVVPTWARPPSVLAPAALFLAACGGGSSPSPSPPPPPPMITQLNPASVVAGSTAFALSVSGTGFLQTATVLWNGTPLATTWNSSTNLSAMVAGTQLAASASIPVTVLNNSSAGSTSNASTFTITAKPPAPTLTSVSPSSIPSNSGVRTVTFTGTGFTPTSRVTEVDPCEIVNGSTFVSATQLTAQILTSQAPSKCSNPGITFDYYFEVWDSSGMSPPSNDLTFSLTPAIPVASAVTPAMVPALQGALAVTVTGDYVSSTSTVYYNGSARPTTLNGQQLIAQLTASDVMAPGTASITIEDPLSGNVASNPLSFSITALPPLSLGSLSPATVPAGNGAFTLTVFGNGFTADSVVAWNGAPLPTTHVSVTTLRASVGAVQVANAASVPVTVVNPAAQGGTSAPLTLTITAPSIDSVAYQIDTGHSGSILFKSLTLPTAPSWSVNVGGAPSYALIVAGRVFVIANANGNSQLLALNAATGATLWGPIAYSGAAGIAHDAGTIFVTSGSNTATGILSAVDAATGGAKWSVAVPGPFAAQSPPVAARGFVYSLDGGMVTAFSESDGSQSWQQTVTGTNGTVAVTVDGVYATAPCATYALQPAVGSVLWTAGTGCGGVGGATPVVGGGRVYSPTGGFYSGSVYESQAGTVLGAFSASAPPAVAAGSAYMLSTATLQAIALSNNQVAWQFTGDGALITAPVVVNGYVFIGSSGGNLYALDAATGAQVWTRNLGAAIPSASTGQSALLSPSGLSAGDGWLIVPAGNTVNAFLLSANP